MATEHNKKSISRERHSWLQQESESWKNTGLIDPDTQRQILQQYQSASGTHVQQHSWSNILLVSLGALLIGGGVILLLAHNWESFGKMTRTILSFLPLVLAQSYCWYGIQYKPKSQAVLETAGVLLFFAVGASISLISQTYHIYGDLERFLLVWLLLGLPIVYTIRSATTLMLLSGLILWLCFMEREPYWLFYGALVPYLYKLYRSNSRNLLAWACWFAIIGLLSSVVYGSAYYASPLDHWSIYISLALGCALYALGYWTFGFENKKFWGNPPVSLGLMVIGFVSLMFTWYGRTLPVDLWQLERPMTANEYTILGLFVACFIGVILFISRYAKRLSVSHWVALTSFVFVILGIIDFYFDIGEHIFVVLSNLYILVGSVILMYLGIQQTRLMILNGGLIWFSFLVLFRFFDSDIPFMAKGIIFIGVGAAFIVANIWFKKKQQSKIEEGE
ncbi:DUF2157 domain-containing protein [Kangiella sediminilitoris]|uniref:DUF2157 domain-containing protein n=1 Tax=Kangiella sediminilitoris TaxID=1144748 RepID=A0A1B3B9H9_9GAMM|nr:DUF2157 domain-containing protein [Kangiella sediminilitoris]AOE49452.1 hypothetical protein KS2013_728 [Kangiella sediminilitoris]